MTKQMRDMESLFKALADETRLRILGLLLSGEAFGAPTSLPWGVPLFGAVRHPTQIYLALAALESLLAREKPKLFILNSVAHNPTGSCMSTLNANRVLELANSR